MNCCTIAQSTKIAFLLLIFQADDCTGLQLNCSNPVRGFSQTTFTRGWKVVQKCQLLKGKNCQQRGVGGQKLVNIVCEGLLMAKHISHISFNPIPTGNGLNQPIYSYHVTQAGRNRVKIHPICQLDYCKCVHASILKCWSHFKKWGKLTCLHAKLRFD